VARAERFAPLVVGCLFAAPVLLAAYPPMSDLPLHEAPIGLLRHWGDRAFAPPTVYFLNLGHANQLFSFLVLALSFVVPITWASKLVVAGSLVALPLAAARLADHLESPRWSALLIAPLGLGWLFFWGLVQNILGMVALLWLLPAIDRFAAKPTARGAVAMCGAMVTLHFAHQAMQLVACAALAIFAVGSDRRVRPWLLRGVPVVFCLALAVAANRYAWSVSGPRHTRVKLFVFYGLWHKIEGISGVLFGGHEPYIRHLMLLLALAGALSIAASRPWAAAWRTWGRMGLAERFHSARFLLLAVLLFAIYLAAPANVQSTTLVYHRFLPPAWAIGVIAATAHVTTVRPLARLASMATTLASLLVTWPTFDDSNRVYTDLAPLLDKIAVGSTVMCLNLGPDPPYRLWNPSVAEGHVVALRGGRSLFDYSQSPTSPVTQRPEKQWVENLNRVEGRPYNLDPEVDLRRFRYVLVSTTELGLGQAVAMAIENEAQLVDQRGIWFLFESKLPLEPIDAPDAPHVGHKGRPLFARLDDVIEKIRRSGGDTSAQPRAPEPMGDGGAP
jgi:hypothetical protein